MPEKRGRKRRPRDRRPSGAPTAQRATRSNAPLRDVTATPAVPSNTARASGLAIAVVTVLLATLTVADGLSGDQGTAETALRIGIGAFLVLLGVVVGVLSVFPAQIRRLIRGE